MDESTSVNVRSELENDSAGLWWTIILRPGSQKVRGSIPLGSTTTTSGIRNAQRRGLPSSASFPRRVRGLRRNHGSRDHSNRLFPVCGRDEYGAGDPPLHLSSSGSGGGVSGHASAVAPVDSMTAITNSAVSFRRASGDL